MQLCLFLSSVLKLIARTLSLIWWVSSFKLNTVVIINGRLVILKDDVYPPMCVSMCTHVDV